LALIILLSHWAGNVLLIVGATLLFGAPMLYVLYADAFIRPLTASHLDAVGRVQVLVKATVLIALVLLFVYLSTKTVLGMRLVGFDDKTSLIQVSSLANFVLVYVSHSLFMAVVCADMLMRMNLSVWRQEREFFRTEAAASYDSLMGSVGQLFEADRES
jgi:hypothetical protein